MLAAANWRQALQVFQASDDSHAWQLRETQLDPYLALEGVPILPRQPETNAGPAVPTLIDYHMCYSHSYQVPIMVFRAMSMDGAALGLDALGDLFPSWPRASEQLLAFAMQQEHPLLPGPCWFSLHPCNTATVLALALGLSADAAHPTGGDEEAGGAAGAVDAAAAGDAAAEGEDAGAQKAGPEWSSRPSPSQVAAAVAVACAVNMADTTTAAAAAALTPTAAEVGAVTSATGGAPGGANHSLSATAAVPALFRDPPALESGAGDPATATHGTYSRCGGPADHPVMPLHQVAPGTATCEPPDAVEEVPDLDQLLAGGSKGVGFAAGLLGPGPGLDDSLAERSEGGRNLGGQAMMGPAGVRWPGGEVPLCPGEEGWLQRYMGAWFSLVGPQVGLRVRSAR